MQNKSMRKNTYLNQNKENMYYFGHLVQWLFNCKNSYISDFCGQPFTFRHRNSLTIRKPIDNALLFLFFIKAE